MSTDKKASRFPLRNVCASISIVSPTLAALKNLKKTKKDCKLPKTHTLLYSYYTLSTDKKSRRFPLRNVCASISIVSPTLAALKNLKKKNKIL